MTLFKEMDPNVICTSCFKLKAGIPGWENESLVIRAELHNDRITFYKSPFGPSDSVSLKLDQISKIDYSYNEVAIQGRRKRKIGTAIVRDYKIYYKNTDGNAVILILGTGCIKCNSIDFDKELRKLVDLPINTEVTHQFL